MHDRKRDLLWQTRIITEVYFFVVVGTHLDFYELLLYEERFWPFSRIWEIWYMDEFVHSKGGSTLWAHLTPGKDDDIPRSGLRTK